jgi:hypothetical protein
VAARTHDERSLRLLVLIDEYTRECLAIRVARRLNSAHVIELLGDCMLTHCLPEHVMSDNSSVSPGLPDHIAADPDRHRMRTVRMTLPLY